MRSILWNPLVRVSAFWVVFLLSMTALDAISTRLDMGLIAERFALAVDLLKGSFADPAVAKQALNSLSELDFIFSLAYGIGAVALSLMCCFLLLHVAMIVFTLRYFRRKIERSDGLQAFAAEYDQSIYEPFKQSCLIGHAWREFDETLVKPTPGEQPVIRNTVRPQSFLNIGMARERLFGLKMLAGIPGYFVAVGLLLTFIGIVLALYKAGEASSGQDVSVMQAAMTELLQIASFKFATSIAGLGASLILSIVFKTFAIWIEGSFSSFCEALERKLKYVPPQSLAIEMNEAAKEQRDQLKEINSDKFFAQMGAQLEPQIQSAFTAAMSPINTSISAALDRISETSQTGVSDMLNQFTNSVQGSAGTELRELAETLKAMQVTLAETQNGVKGSGEDFARRMSESAENLNRLVSEAAGALGAGAAQNRDELAEIMSAMKTTFENANAQIDAQLGNAAGAASSRIEEAMGRVLEKLEGQVDTVSSNIASFDTTLRDGLTHTQSEIQKAQQSAAETVASVAQSSAEAIREGLTDAIASIRAEVDRFEDALGKSGAALTSQASAIGDATSQTRLVSDAFAKTANDVRVAAAPLIQSGEKIATATTGFEQSLQSAVESLSASQQAAGELATSIRGQGEQLIETWREYEGRFVRIDEALAKAIGDLAGATESQGETLSRYTSDIDQGLARAVTQLSATLNDIQGSVEEFGEAVTDLKSAMRTAAE
ncbi:anti-phage ZorAB system protein ZorA [Hoeflea sp.]|uniref:anti-phage ZorAB system protein ZorA n=1 Tax=Hoeflea sp. TaxID=1940281 RepID=UPI003A95501E